MAEEANERDESKASYHVTIPELPAQERPRERLRDQGAAALSNSELLAIILRTGVRSENVLTMASRLLGKCGGLPGLARASFQELSRQHGVGEAKAAQVKAALEMGRRLTSLQPGERATVSSPQDVERLFLGEMSEFEQEHFRVLLLDTRNRLTGVSEVYKGNVNASIIRMAEVFRDAVRQNCPSIIAVHNHPSGDPSPSSEDVEVTRQMISTGKLLDIELLDHIVIGREGSVSLRERGLAFGPA